MLRWEDREDGATYGYADKILVFSVYEQDGSALPWRLSSSLPGMPVLAGQERHLARGDAKAQAGKVMDDFLKASGLKWATAGS
ncbi:hypothetical protein ABT282_08440 [Streptomyces sp. NPDC000927]|uniref:hypothetical protein n=1 Tax=Streptomyces sp. NPDC000927 TaxID=3154371 RepID=UPI00332FC85A